MTREFRWIDGERTIVFGAGAIAQAGELLGDGGYAVLTTPRARSMAPDVVTGATAVHEVGPGRVDDLAGELRGSVEEELLVALGGGRVIDVAKALAAADPPRRVASIPTTLSGAEMTTVHRHAAGVSMATPRVRPAIVINDPQLCASQPVPALAESACNALGHAGEGPLTPLHNPVATLAALESARQIAEAFFGSAEPDREALALGSLLAGYVIGSTGYGLHHILSQTLARFAGVGHGAANAIMLPHSLLALGRRFPEQTDAFGAALGGDGAVGAAEIAMKLCALTGTTRLQEAGVTTEMLERCAEEAAGRPELAMTPPAADRDELLFLYKAAW